MQFKLRYVKVAVIAAFGIFALIFILASGSSNITTHASVGGAPTGRTGAPGESTCTSCHSQNTGAGQFNIIAPSSYVPGQTYTIQVQHATADTSRLVWGFELIPVTGGNAMAGTLVNTSANTRIRVSGTKSYATQTTAGSFPGQSLSAGWSFDWTAPATDVGNVTLYAAGLQGDNSADESGDQTYTRSVVITPSVAAVIHHGYSDFDADGRADAAVYRPSDRYWYITRSTAGFAAVQWGDPTDKLVPGDYDGDDKADIAVWREAPADQAAFYILQSSTNAVRVELFGKTGDEPVAVGDWDGDGKADPAVYRDSAFGSQSYFFYRGSLNNPGRTITYVPWGTAGDRAMRGDFDGDGKIDAAVFRPSNAVWYILQSASGTVRYDRWGLATDTFVPADYDGDAKTDLAVFRGGTWYVRQSSNGLAAYLDWGTASDLPAPADYDGDGKTDVAVYRSGVWYLRQSSSASLRVINFGAAADKPIASSFVR